MDYKFDPEKFGFEPISNFPELHGWFGNPTFIKVSAFGTKEMYGRKVYWYIACTPTTHDDRIKFYEHSYSADKAAFSEFNKPRTVYFGLLSSDKFAKQLLSHLFGTTKNESVETDGIQRLEDNLNEQLRKEHK